MSSITYPYTFVNGTTILAPQVNSNFTAVSNVVNGSIDNTNISNSAQISLTKLGLDPASQAFAQSTTGQFTWGSGLTTDANPQQTMTSNAGLQFGPGGATPPDVRLNRSAALTLQLGTSSGGSPTAFDMNGGSIINCLNLTVTGTFTTPSLTTTGALTGGTVVSKTSLTAGINGTAGGTLVLEGATSGATTVGVNATAGATTFNLPVGNGASGQILQGDGAGNLSYGSQTVLVATANVSSAQLLASTTNIVLLAAPGAGKTIIVHKILWRMTRTGSVYASGASANFQYGTSGVAVTAAPGAGIVTSGTAGTLDYIMTGIDLNASTGPASSNDSIVFKTSSNFTGGTGTAVAYVYYSVI